MKRAPTKEARDRQLNLSLTATELESIRRRAEAVGLRTAHFGRALLLDPAQKANLPKEAGSNLNRLIFSQLARLGNNLNQIARHLNRTGDPLPVDLEPLLRDIRQILMRAPL